MRPCPLRIFILAHPQSLPGRALCEALMRRFVEPPASGGLRIPVFFTPIDGTDLPPSWVGVDGVNLDHAEHTLVVVLSDCRMMRIVKDGTGAAWKSFFAEGMSLAAPATTPHYCFGVALDSDGFSIAESQHMVRTPRDTPPSNNQNDIQRWVDDVVDDVALHIAIRSIQKLDSRVVPTDSTEARAPIQLFLSHAKADLSSDEHDPVRYVENDVKELPIDYWFDAAEIPPSEQFADEIEKGIRDCSIVLSFLTDNYSSRPWCQREILDAKKLGVPILVVDALSSGEPRNFPYLGNLPTIHWSGNDPKLEARRIVSRAARETLRYIYNRRSLSLSAKAGDNEFVLASAPEALTLAQFGKSSAGAFIYPDPPLADQELRVLQTLVPDATFTTPLTEIAKRLQEMNRLVGVSISASGDLARHGLSEEHERTLSDELHLYLLLGGCQIAYGGALDGDFRKGSNFTLRLFELVRSYSSLALRVSGTPLAPIVNYAAWPLRLGYGDPEFGLFGSIAKYSEGPRPTDAEIPEADESLFPSEEGAKRKFPSDTPERRLAWARGLTAMRTRMCREVDARVVVGGRIVGYAGLYPGIVEEAWMSLVSRQPLFLIGAFGGAARVLIDCMTSRDPSTLTSACQPQHLTECIDLAKNRGLTVFDGNAASLDLPSDKSLVTAGQIAFDFLDAMSKGTFGVLNNGLNDDENLELFYTTSPMAIAELVLTGLARIPKQEN